MQKAFPIALISFSLALIGACDPEGNPARPNANTSASATNPQSTRSGGPAQPQTGQKPEWISLKSGICKFDRMDQASSQFELTCPVAIKGFVWDFIQAGKGIHMAVGDYNNNGPVDLSFEKSPDGYRVTGRARGKDVAISIELEDGRVETLQIQNPIQGHAAPRAPQANTGSAHCTSEFINDYRAVAFEMTLISKFSSKEYSRAKSYCEQFFKKHSGVRCRAQIKGDKDLDYKEGFLSADDLRHNCDVVAKAI